MFPSFFLLRFAKACLFVLKENFSGNLISMISKKKKKKKKDVPVLILSLVRAILITTK